MMRFMVLVMAAVLVLAPVAYAGNNLGPVRSPGPAPNSGDGIPDGSGFDDDMSLLNVLGLAAPGPGPAPNSGDGIPDGSGFEVPPKGAK